MEIARDDIVNLLRGSDESAAADRAADGLPDPVDIDDDEHLQLMSKLGIDPSILSKLDGMGGSPRP